MRKTSLLLLVAVACGAPPSTTEISSALDKDVPPGEIKEPRDGPLAVPEDTSHGSLVVVAPAEPDTVDLRKNGYHLVPGLSGVIRSRAGDSLAITVSMEVRDTAPLAIRTLVDGALAEPSFVYMKRESGGEDGARSFTWVVPSIGEGQHTVQVESWSQSIQRIRARSLTMRSMARDAGSSRLAVSSAANDLIFGSRNWSVLTGMSTTIVTDRVTTLATTFSADSLHTGRTRVRALLNGIQVNHAIFADGASSPGARAYTFVSTSVPPGTYTMSIQVLQEEGQSIFHGRTLSVVAMPPELDGGGFGQDFQSSEVTYADVWWTDVIETSFVTSSANASLAMTFGGELRGSGHMFVRALLDGGVVFGTSAEVVTGGSTYRANGFTFVTTNVKPGSHNLRFQIRSSGTVRLSDHWFTVEHRRRSATELMKPYFAMAPRWQRPPAVVICFDPVRPEHPIPTLAEVRATIEGLGTPLSAASYFQFNGGGTTAFSSVEYVGCDDSGWLLAPKEHRGDWYWDNHAWDPVMHRDSIEAADPFFDFHAYDLDENGKLTPDELTVMVVKPQQTPYGTNRAVDVSTDGAGELNILVVDLYVSPPVWHRWNVGTAAHELAHAVVGAFDLHSCPAITSPGMLSLMDQHQGATHLDPLHRLKTGFGRPSFIDLETWVSPGNIALPPAGGTGQFIVIHDRSRGDREYFAVELRTRGDLFDQGLGFSGLVVWHLLEDRALALQFPPAGGATCTEDRLSVRKLDVLRFPNSYAALAWADGSSTRMKVTLLDTPSDTSTLVNIRVEPNL